MKLGLITKKFLEEWALLIGMNMVWDLRTRKVIFDSNELIDRINTPPTNIGTYSSIWNLIVNMSRRNWLLKFQFVPKEPNMLADKLAKDGLSSSHVFSFIDTVPDSLRTLVHQDICNVVFD